MEEEEEVEIKKSEKLEAEKLQVIMRTLDMEEEAWGARKSQARGAEIKDQMKTIGPLEPTRAAKREQEPVKGRRAKKLKHATMEENWGKEKPKIEQQAENTREQPTSREQLTPKELLNSPSPPTPNPISSPPHSSSQNTSSPAQISPSNPDDCSQNCESNEQGFPPVLVAPSVEHLHAGHLGEVTKGWGSRDVQ